MDHVKCKNIKLLGYGRKIFMMLELGSELLAMTPKVWSVKKNIDKLDFIKISNFDLWGTLLKSKYELQTGRKHSWQTTYIQNIS